MLFNVLGIIAECGSELITMRTGEGMTDAKAKAKGGGLRGEQPTVKPAQEAHLVELGRSDTPTSAEVAELFSVARATVDRAGQRAEPTTPVRIHRG